LRQDLDDGSQLLDFIFFAHQLLIVHLEDNCKTSLLSHPPPSQHYISPGPQEKQTTSISSSTWHQFAAHSSGTSGLVPPAFLKKSFTKTKEEEKLVLVRKTK
jgi:hypothetical protein